MPYQVIYELAAAAAEEYMKREMARQDQAQGERAMIAIIDAISDAKQEILDALREMSIHQLMGEFVGLNESLGQYMRYPASHTYDNLLLIRRDSDSLKGKLQQEVQAYRTNPQTALEAYPILLAHTAFRCSVLAERKFAWGENEGAINEDITREIDEALSFEDAIYEILRGRIKCSSRGPIHHHGPEGGDNWDDNIVELKDVVTGATERRVFSPGQPGNPSLPVRCDENDATFRSMRDWFIGKSYGIKAALDQLRKSRSLVHG